MGKEEKELSDIVVIVVEAAGLTTRDAAQKLQEVGLEVSGMDENECVVEGTIATEKLVHIRKLEFVKYVRDVFNYLSEQGESEEDELSSEADDAGA